MKKIETIVKGVSESVKDSYKVRRIEKSLEIATLNASEDLEVAKQELEEFPTKAINMSADQIVEELFKIFGEIEDNEAILARLDKVKKYLNSEE